MNPPLEPAARARLDDLAARALREADHFRIYQRPWVKPRTHPSGAPVHNVFIVGAGHSGAGAWWGLRLNGVDRVAIVDARERGQAGVWAHYDRMESLRTPKDLTGPDWGLPSLTFRAYCTERFGEAYWNGLRRTMRRDYADYMEWYRETLQIPIQYRTSLVGLEPEGDLFRLACTGPNGPEVAYARTVILATGYATDGEPFVPAYLRALDPARCRHAAEDLRFGDLKGRRVGILGHGAGAFDCAGMALAAGAASVDLCFRRKEIPTVNPYRWFEFPGFQGHYHELDDAMRLKFERFLAQRDQPPAQGGYERAMGYSNFALHPGTDWVKAEATAEGVRVTTTRGVMDFGFVIAATGLTDNVTFRSELSALLPHVATWGDRPRPAGEAEDAGLHSRAYLGPHFELTEKVPGQAPYLGRVFVFSSGAAVSHGPSITSLSGLRFALPRVVDGVCSRLFTGDAEAFYADCERYAEPELRLIPPEPAGD